MKTDEDAEPSGGFCAADKPYTPSSLKGSAAASGSFAGNRPLKCHESALVVLAVVVPNVVELVSLSPILGLKVGLRIYNGVADMSLYGDAILCLSAVVIIAYFIFDMHKTGRWQLFALVVPWFLFTVGSMLKGRKYPWAPMLWVISHIAFILGAFRFKMMSDTRPKHFYSVVLASSLFCAILAGVLWIIWRADGNAWGDSMEARLAADVPRIYSAFGDVECAGIETELNYSLHCGPQKNLTFCSNLARSEINADCKIANTVVFMFWCNPLIICLCNLVIGIFVYFEGVLGSNLKRSRENRLVKQCVLGIATVAGCMYGAALTSGASVQLGGTLMAFVLAGMTFLVGWLAVEMGHEALLDKAKSSCAPAVEKIWKMGGDWLRAMLGIVLCMVGPPFLFVDVLHHGCRRIRGKLDDESDLKSRFTPGARWLIEQVMSWDLASVLTKICLLTELFFCLQVLFAKGVYIFLSALNVFLSDLGLPFIVICALVFLIGWAMFLIPVVPGIPVYLFSGIVIAAQGNEEPGFGAACVIAVIVAFVNKLFACACQYRIGVSLGNNVKVQQMIGVDKPGTRALEVILRKPGLDIGKVGVLVGGPDWPISVTCGILHSSMIQMLIGTLPVICVVGPIVLAGAFMSQATAGTDSIEGTIAQFLTLISTAVVAGSGLIAAYYTMEVLEKQKDTLSQPRPEHAAVEALTKKEEAWKAKYQEITQWDKLGTVSKGLLIIATVFMVISFAMFGLMNEALFRTFMISSKIDESYDNFGLKDENGYSSPLNIIILPLGAVPIALFFIGALMHLTFSKLMSCRTKTATERQTQPEEK